MSKKDEALKLALETLEGIHTGNMTPMAEEAWNKAITTLRAALAEQPAQQQEHVSVMTVLHLKDRTEIGYGPASAGYDLPTGEYKLYTSPPASKPLTDEQIDRAIAELGINYFADAANNRAVLRELCRKAAHGIKEDA